MKNTALTHIHESLGAKLVPFAGFNMPVQYEGVTVEHETVRNGVGVFDVSHMGEFMLRGPHALDLIQRITSNDASKLEIGKVQYSCLPNDKGGIVDDLLVYKIKENQLTYKIKKQLIEGSFSTNDAAELLSQLIQAKIKGEEYAGVVPFVPSMAIAGAVWFFRGPELVTLWRDWTAS